MICKAFDYDLEKDPHCRCRDDGGDRWHWRGDRSSGCRLFPDAKKAEQLDDLLEEIHLEKYVPNETEQIFAGKNFVITGSLIHFCKPQ